LEFDLLVGDQLPELQLVRVDPPADLFENLKYPRVRR